jgi:hypothetical protein
MTPNHNTLSEMLTYKKWQDMLSMHLCSEHIMTNYKIVELARISQTVPVKHILCLLHTFNVVWTMGLQVTQFDCIGTIRRIMKQTIHTWEYMAAKAMQLQNKKPTSCLQSWVPPLWFLEEVPKHILRERYLKYEKQVKCVQQEQKGYSSNHSQSSLFLSSWNKKNLFLEYNYESATTW